MKKRTLYSLLVVVFIGYLIFFRGPILGIGGVYIASNSMAPNLLSGDRVFVYSTAPQIGDVVRLKGARGRPYAKRLVAVGGDRICFNKEDFLRETTPERKHLGSYNVVAYDGSAQTEYKMYEELSGNHTYNTLYPPQFDQSKSCRILPQDEFFFVGDNRARSLDSRYENFPRKFQNESYYKLSFIFYSSDLSRIFTWVK